MSTEVLDENGEWQKKADMGKARYHGLAIPRYSKGAVEGDPPIDITLPEIREPS